jgi:hypothetical protein
VVCAVSRRSLNTEARVHAQVIQCGICGEQIGTGADSIPGSSVLPCQYHSTMDLILLVAWVRCLVPVWPGDGFIKVILA